MSTRHASGDGAPPRHPTVARTGLGHDMAHLADLVDHLDALTPTRPIDDRELELVGAAVTPDIAEQQLRGIRALLLTLHAYLRSQRTTTGSTAARSTDDGRPAAPAVHDNGASPAQPSDPELAAAAARYIARDLAARQLSEFTSAEGYRLARALARIGGDEAAVDQLLGEANTIRLHPVPLTDALSHSAQ
ncbi:hypothetical protein BH23ACT10_BH23ACT10_19520 [soil metagenome]